MDIKITPKSRRSSERHNSSAAWATRRPWRVFIRMFVAHGRQRSLNRKCPPTHEPGMYSGASLKTCEFRTTNCFDVPLNQSIELIFGLSSKVAGYKNTASPRDLILGWRGCSRVPPESQ